MNLQTICNSSFIFLLLLNLATPCFGQINPEIVKGFGGKFEDEGTTITSDKDSNLIVAGYFTETIILGNDTLHGRGWNDVFIAKLDTGFNVIWAKHFGGEAFDWSTALVTDDLGNIYLSGAFSGTIVFKEDTVTSAGDLDLYVIKLDASGTVLWYRTFGGLSSDQANDMDIDGSGNILLGGYFSYTIKFGNNEFESKGKRDIFVLKLDAEGEVLWAVQEGGIGSDECKGIYAGPNDDVLITGFFEGRAFFGDKEALTRGWTDGFTARYDKEGALNWLATFGGYDDDFGKDLIADADGNIYVTGMFLEQTFFGDKEVFAETLSVNSLFLAKYNVSGQVEFVRTFGSSKACLALSIIFDDDQNVCLSGYIRGKGNFASQELPASHKADVFVTKYTRSGEYIWVKHWKSKGDDYSTSMVRGAGGYLYLTGAFTKSLFIADIPAFSAGKADILLIRISTDIIPLEEE